MRVVVIEHITLDGVIQGPGRPDEDTRGGFRLGGWAQGEVEPEMSAAMGAHMRHGFAWLFGRTSYDGMLSHWNEQGGPFAEGLNGTTKYVASSHPDAELRWPNSVRLTGDVPARVAELRQQESGDLVVMGSGALVRSLLPHGLVDELLLFVHPIVLGSGARMFAAESDLVSFRLVSAASTASGIVVTAYEADRSESRRRRSEP